MKATIESLYKQSYPKDRYEIIIIDNASDDETDKMILSIQPHAPRALNYISKNDDGPGVARNLGLSKAIGSIVAFIEDDCIADPQWLERGVSRMIDGVGLVQGTTLPNPHQTRKTFSRTQEIIRENKLYQTCNMFYRKEDLDLVGGFSPEFIGRDFFGKTMMSGEDADLAWKVKKLGWKSVFAEDAVVYHHVFSLRPGKLIISYRKCQLFFYTWPNLLQKHPEMRKDLLYLQLFREKQNALFFLFLISIIVGTFFHWSFFFLMFPYAVNLVTWSFNRRSLRTYPRGFIVFIIYILKDLVNFILLLCGSIWYRSLVL